MPKKPGSLASEAERLAKALGRSVTIDQVRYWRSKGYDLHDIPGLKHNLSNQQHVWNRKSEKIDADKSWRETVAFKYLPDEKLLNIRGAVDIADVLHYLRDRWETDELQSDRAASMSEAENLKFAQRTVMAQLLGLTKVFGVDVVAEEREELCDALWPD
jgi:hypothetical protein